MKVHELRELLETLPDDMPVYIGSPGELCHIGSATRISKGSRIQFYGMTSTSGCLMLSGSHIWYERAVPVRLIGNWKKAAKEAIS